MRFKTSVFKVAHCCLESSRSGVAMRYLTVSLKPKFAVVESFKYRFQDILRARVQTSGIFETKFSVDKVNFQ